MGWSWNTAMLPYNDEWRAQRRHFHGEFDGRAISKHYTPIIRSTHDLLQRFLDTPEQWQSHIRQCVANLDYLLVNTNVRCAVLWEPRS